MRPGALPEFAEVRRCLAAALLLVTPLIGAGAGAAQESHQLLTGAEILEHPAGQAVLEAARLMHAGELDQVKRASDAYTRDEWAATSEEERRLEAEIAQERAPDPATFAEDIAAAGELVIQDQGAVLRWTAADETSAVMAFAALEDGVWKVTGGPTVIRMAPLEEGPPPLSGADILEHEIGRVVLALAGIVASGDFDSAMELATDEIRAQRAEADPDERAESERYWRENLPAPAELEDRIRSGGQLYFEGDDRATLILSTTIRTENADGSVDYSYSSTSLPFHLVRDVWRFAG